MADKKRSSIRYEPNENPKGLLSLGLGAQMAILALAGIVFTPIIIIRAGLGDGHDEYLTWAVFAAVLISGIVSIIQARRVGRIGAGYVLMMGSSAAFIAVCISALQSGGAALLATLVVVSALFQFLLAWRLAIFRRVLTPAVSGTVLMLIAVAVMPIAFDMLSQVPEGAAPSAAPVIAFSTLAVICIVALTARGILRLWAPIIGTAVGSVIAIYYGVFDTAPIAEAAWFGISFAGFQGLDLSFGVDFWTLLPAYIFVTLIGAIETIGDSIAIQKVSWRRSRATDFRAVQGALNADGMGNLLAGLAGTVPNTTYSSSISMTELTGVASRHVGVAIGGVFLFVALFPKVLAVAIAIPSPVIASFLFVLIPMLFVVGMRLVVESGVTYRTAIIVGLSFWVGVGFQQGTIFPDLWGEDLGALLGNGMTSGGVTAILLTLFADLMAGRRKRLRTDLAMESLPELRTFVERYAKRTRWDEALRGRIQIACEEALVSLAGGESEEQLRHLRVTIRNDSGTPEIEFVASDSHENLEDRIALLHEVKPTSVANLEEDVSFRILHHVTSSVEHSTYHDVDIVKVRVR